MKCAGRLRCLWPRPIRNDRTATSGRTVVGRKGTCGTANTTVPLVREAPRRVQGPETTGRMPPARVSRVSIQIARVPTGRIRTNRAQSVLRRTVHIQTDHIQTARVPTGHMLTVPGRRDRGSTAHQGQVGERGVRGVIIEDSSLRHVVVLLIAEGLVARRNRVASLSAATLPISSR